MKRVPREAISENQPEQASYSANDAQRFNSRGGNALAGTGTDGIGRSFEFVEVKTEEAVPDPAPSSSALSMKYAFVHKCEGCEFPKYSFCHFCDLQCNFLR